MVENPENREQLPPVLREAREIVNNAKPSAKEFVMDKMDDLLTIPRRLYRNNVASIVLAVVTALPLGYATIDNIIYDREMTHILDETFPIIGGLPAFTDPKAVVSFAETTRQRESERRSYRGYLDGLNWGRLDKDRVLGFGGFITVVINGVLLAFNRGHLRRPGHTDRDLV